MALSGDVTCNGGQYNDEVATLGPSFALAQYYDKTFGTCEGPNPNGLGFAQDVLSKGPAATKLAEVTRAVE